MEAEYLEADTKGLLRSRSSANLLIKNLREFYKKKLREERKEYEESFSSVSLSEEEEEREAETMKAADRFKLISKEDNKETNYQMNHQTFR